MKDAPKPSEETPPGVGEDGFAKIFIRARLRETRVAEKDYCCVAAINAIIRQSRLPSSDLLFRWYSFFMIPLVLFLSNNTDRAYLSRC